MNRTTRADAIRDTRRAHDRVNILRRAGAQRREILSAIDEAQGHRRYAASIGRVASLGRAFYVTIQRDTQCGLLYGPFATQELALAQVDRVRELAHRIASADAAFSSFGTGSLPIEDARFGTLNSHLPAIDTVGAAQQGVAA